MTLSAVLSMALAPSRAAAVEDESPSVKHHDVAGRQIVTREVLASPYPAPDFRLLASSREDVGVPLSLSELRGKTVLLTFAYNNCREACPLLLKSMLFIQPQFADAFKRKELAFVVVSTDPERDTPEKLHNDARARAARWFFMTASLPELEKVYHDYGIYWELKQRNKASVIYHSYKTYLIDKNGRVRVKYVGLWQPETLISDLHWLLEEKPNG